MPAGPQELRTVAFGTSDGGTWGVLWDHGSPVVLLASAEGEAPRPIAGVSVSQTTAAGEWLIEGDGLNLRVSGAGASAASVEGGDLDGFDQPCRAEGEATIAGAAVSIDCPGIRGSWQTGALAECQSLRRVCVWFDGAEGLAVLAVRPRKARDHGRDVVAASALEPAGTQTVADPRLSTTYDREGRPRKAGLELWIDGENDSQYSRRAAGQSMDVAGEVSDDSRELRADLFRWQSRGREGVGVYLLSRVR